jgi:hypothetical protein
MMFFKKFWFSFQLLLQTTFIIRCEAYWAQPLPIQNMQNSQNNLNVNNANNIQGKLDFKTLYVNSLNVNNIQGKFHF